MKTKQQDSETARVHRERSRLIVQIEHALELPMIILGLIWLALLVVDLTRGLGPVLRTTTMVIWGIFIVDFLLRFVLAPAKAAYLRRNWLTAIALFVPALRVFRIARVLRVVRLARGLNLVRVLGTMNRGLRTLRRTTRRRGLPYVLGVTLMVVTLASAGLYALERGAADQEAFSTYGNALWWTMLRVITTGSDAWPVTVEGRLLALAVSIYGFTFLGYITAVLASWFIHEDELEERKRDRRMLRQVQEELRETRGGTPV